MELITKAAETAEQNNITYPNLFGKKLVKAKALVGLKRFDEARDIIYGIYNLADGTPDEVQLYLACAKLLDEMGDDKAAELAVHALDILSSVDEPDTEYISTLEKIAKRSV